MKAFVRVGNRVKKNKKTTIGHSPLTRFTNKDKKRRAKLYRGQGKAVS